MMQAELVKLGERLAEAESEVRREHRETQELRDSYQHHLEAAQLLQARAAADADAQNAAAIEASLAKIVLQLERMKPDIEREEREDQEVEAWRGELRQAFEDLGGKIRAAEGQLISARRQMDMARLQKQRAQDSDRIRGGVSILTGAIGSLSVALDAMNQETSKVRTETEALKLRAELFQSNRLENDAHIAEALATARGKAAPSRASLSDRLAALAIGDAGSASSASRGLEA